MRVLFRLYQLRRRAGIPRRMALRLAWLSVRMDRTLQRERARVLKRAQVPFVESR